MRTPQLVLVAAVLLGAQTAKLPDISYDATQALGLQQTPVKDYGFARLIDISYASPRGGRVPAYAVIPARAARPAGIVWQHAGQGDRSSFLPEALALAQRGAASILIDAPWLRPNARRASTPDAELAGWLQSAVDLRRAIDVLTQSFSASPARIAYVGHSYGATLGGVLAVGERRFRTLVLMAGFGSISDAILHPKNGAAPDAAAKKESAAMAAIDADRFIGQAAPATLLLQFARYDRFISDQQARRYADAASNPKDVRWYDCGHELNDSQAVRDRADWLDKQLGLSAHVAALHAPGAIPE